MEGDRPQQPVSNDDQKIIGDLQASRDRIDRHDGSLDGRVHSNGEQDEKLTTTFIERVGALQKTIAQPGSDAEREVARQLARGIVPLLRDVVLTLDTGDAKTIEKNLTEAERTMNNGFEAFFEAIKPDADGKPPVIQEMQLRLEARGRGEAENRLAEVLPKETTVRYLEYRNHLRAAVNGGAGKNQPNNRFALGCVVYAVSSPTLEQSKAEGDQVLVLYDIATGNLVYEDGKTVNKQTLDQRVKARGEELNNALDVQHEKQFTEIAKRALGIPPAPTPLQQKQLAACYEQYLANGEKKGVTLEMLQDSATKMESLLQKAATTDPKEAARLQRIRALGFGQLLNGFPDFFEKSLESNAFNNRVDQRKAALNTLVTQKDWHPLARFLNKWAPKDASTNIEKMNRCGIEIKDINDRFTAGFNFFHNNSGKDLPREYQELYKLRRTEYTERVKQLEATMAADPDLSTPQGKQIEQVYLFLINNIKTIDIPRVEAEQRERVLEKMHQTVWAAEDLRSFKIRENPGNEDAYKILTKRTDVSQKQLTLLEAQRKVQQELSQESEKRIAALKKQGAGEVLISSEQERKKVCDANLRSYDEQLKTQQNNNTKIQRDWLEVAADLYYDGRGDFRKQKQEFAVIRLKELPEEQQKKTDALRALVKDPKKPPLDREKAEKLLTIGSGYAEALALLERRMLEERNTVQALNIATVLENNLEGFLTQDSTLTAQVALEQSNPNAQTVLWNIPEVIRRIDDASYEFQGQGPEVLLQYDVTDKAMMQAIERFTPELRDFQTRLRTISARIHKRDPHIRKTIASAEKVQSTMKPIISLKELTEKYSHLSSIDDAKKLSPSEMREKKNLEAKLERKKEIANDPEAGRSLYQELDGDKDSTPIRLDEIRYGQLVTMLGGSWNGLTLKEWKELQTLRNKKNLSITQSKGSVLSDKRRSEIVDLLDRYDNERLRELERKEKNAGPSALQHLDAATIQKLERVRDLRDIYKDYIRSLQPTGTATSKEKGRYQGVKLTTTMPKEDADLAKKKWREEAEKLARDLFTPQQLATSMDGYVGLIEELINLDWYAHSPAGEGNTLSPLEEKRFQELKQKEEGRPPTKEEYDQLKALEKGDLRFKKFSEKGLPEKTLEEFRDIIRDGKLLSSLHELKREIPALASAVRDDLRTGNRMSKTEAKDRDVALQLRTLEKLFGPKGEMTEIIQQLEEWQSKPETIPAQLGEWLKTNGVIIGVAVVSTIAVCSVVGAPAGGAGFAALAGHFALTTAVGAIGATAGTHIGTEIVGLYDTRFKSRFLQELADGEISKDALTDVGKETLRNAAMMGGFNVVGKVAGSAIQKVAATNSRLAQWTGLPSASRGLLRVHSAIEHGMEKAMPGWMKEIAEEFTEEWWETIVRSADVQITKDKATDGALQFAIGSLAPLWTSLGGKHGSARLQGVDPKLGICLETYNGQNKSLSLTYSADVHGNDPSILTKKLKQEYGFTDQDITIDQRSGIITIESPQWKDAWGTKGVQRMELRPSTEPIGFRSLLVETGSTVHTEYGQALTHDRLGADYGVAYNPTTREYGYTSPNPPGKLSLESYLRSQGMLVKNTQPGRFVVSIEGETVVFRKS